MKKNGQSTLQQTLINKQYSRRSPEHLKKVFVGVLLGFFIIMNINFCEQRVENKIITTVKNISDTIISAEMLIVSQEMGRKAVIITDQIVLQELKKTIQESYEGRKEKAFYDINSHLSLKTSSGDDIYISLYFDYGSDDIVLLLAQEKTGRHVSMIFRDDIRFWELYINQLYS